MYRSTIGKHVPDAVTELIGSKGVDVLRRIGITEVKKVVGDVLCGINVRNSTELLTRRRIAMLNAATLILFLRGAATSRRFLAALPDVAVKGLKGKVSKQERWLLQWILGLTTKGVQNILRDSTSALDQYKAGFVKTHREIVAQCVREFGPIAGVIQSRDGKRVPVSWEFMLGLFCTIGSQTLAIRGSEKSTYGKLFERLVLGSVLEVLGFKHTKEPPTVTENVFWLSSRLETRESDGTALCGPGQAVRFDIGFIGRGNPEISKDKVSRFERQIEVGSKKYFCATFVIVDSIGQRSRIVEQAKAINGTIIQMSMSYWPRLLAKALEEKVGFRSRLSKVPDSQIESLLRREAGRVNIERFIEVSASSTSEDDNFSEDE